MKPLEYGAIAIDTNIFIKYQWNFRLPPLKNVEMFNDHVVDYVVPDIVRHEMGKHIKEIFIIRKAEAKKGIKALNRFFAVDNVPALTSEIFSDAYPYKLLNDFFLSTGAYIFNCSNVDADRLVYMYSETMAPFAGKNKKTEFPDAIALLALENWAQNENKKVLAVSEDGGWFEYAKNSEYIDVVTDINRALELFQPENILNSIGNYFKKSVQYDRDLIEHIKISVENELKDYSGYPEACSVVRYDIEEMSLSLKDLELVKYGDGFSSRVIGYGTNYVEVSYDLKIEYTAIMSILFYVYEECDIPSGNKTIECDMQCDAEAIVEFSGDITTGLDKMSISNIECSGIDYDIDIGKIGPNWR